jgi:hypothetical protein
MLASGQSGIQLDLMPLQVADLGSPQTALKVLKKKMQREGVFRLVDIVVTDENLDAVFLFDQAIARTDA